MSVLERLKKLKDQFDYDEKYLENLKQEKIHLEDLNVKYTKFLNIINAYIEENFNNNIELINNYVTELVKPNFNIDFKLHVEKNSKAVTVKSFIREYEQTDEFHDIIDASGGGLYDFVSLILRLLFFTKTNNIKTIFIDEPFKNVSDLNKGTILLLFKNLVDMLGLQIIMITHEDSYVELSDSIYVVGYKQSSYIEELVEKTGKEIVMIKSIAKSSVEDIESEDIINEQ